jgi:hypothetical protein
MDDKMKKALAWVSGLLVIVLVAVVGMAVFNLCPPQGPWPQPPWCPGSPFVWPFSQPGEVVDVDPGMGVEQRAVDTEEKAVVFMAEQIFSGLTRVQTYFDQGIRGMGQFTPEVGRATSMGASAIGGGSRLACIRPLQGAGPYNIPGGFMGPRAANGYIGAPAGACGAGASPVVRFHDQTGEPITGDRLVTEDVQTIDFATLTGQDPDIQSLESMITEALQPGDMSLTTTSGWNEVLWERLAAQQQPMDSLIDYHLWNTADEIEALVVDSIESRMEMMGIPDSVIEAFRQSDRNGWFASRPSTLENELASMDVIAEFDGNFHGTIEEERTFRISAPGEMPAFGPMTGSGELTFDHPSLGLLTFDVELAWSEWDEFGRVNGGEMHMVEQSGGYEIHMTFRPDGTKEGEVYMKSELVGRVEMIVEGNNSYMEFLPLE